MKNRLYKNVMEDLVEFRFDEIQSTLDCCTCEHCRNDIIAYALNLLPQKYVVSDKGAVYSNITMVCAQHSSDIIAALTKGAQIVKKSPRH